jgi:hypothetical protein
MLVGYTVVLHFYRKECKGLIIDDTLTWKQHIEYLKKKITLACFTLRNIKDTVSLDALKLICFANVHSIISYGIIFWGDSSCINKVFILQKKSYQNNNRFKIKRVL